MDEQDSFKNQLHKIYNIPFLKEFMIIILIFLIILVVLYDKILPLFIQIEIDFLNNLITIVPLIICITVFVLAICSKFKIFGKNSLFDFNHKILNFNKYKIVINRKIAEYKNKLYRINKLYNQNKLIRNKIKTNINDLTKNNQNLNNMTNKLMKDCTELNEKNKKFTGIFINKTRDNIQDVAFTGKNLFDQTVAIREARMLKAEQNAKTAAERQQTAASFEVQRQKLIQNEQNRRKIAVANERLRRARKAQQAKNVWVKNELARLNHRFHHEGMQLYVHPNFQGYCGTYKVNIHHYHGTICHGHDVISSFKIPQFLVVDVFQHNHNGGRRLHHLRGTEYGYKNYNVGFLSAHGLNDQISSIRTYHDAESYARLARARARIHNRKLVTFGNLKVEGQYAPGLNKDTTYFRG